jgi:hypothetical protein
MKYNKDDSPLYIFDGNFDNDDVSSSLLSDYAVPPYFPDDLFRLVGEKRRPPYRWEQSLRGGAVPSLTVVAALPPPQVVPSRPSQIGLLRPHGSAGHLRVEHRLVGSQALGALSSADAEASRCVSGSSIHPSIHLSHLSIRLPVCQRKVWTNDFPAKATRPRTTF